MKLSKLIHEYVYLKQSLGMRFRSEAGLLRSFLKALGDQEAAAITTEAVGAFLVGKGAITATWHLKYRILNGLFRFALGRGHLEISPLPRILPKEPEPQPPHIYSTDELRRLLAATVTLQCKMSPLQAATFQALLLTLYGTGLRIGEALSLTLADVDLAESIITVRESKFYKTRLVPIGPRLNAHLEGYLSRRSDLPCPFGQASAVFVTRTGKGLSYHRARKIFGRLRHHAGIRIEDGLTFAPRLHDLRHTFAVHRLELWYRDGADVQRLLPSLATYLGHEGVVHTQRYLPMTCTLLQEARARFENYALAEVSDD